VSGDNNSNGWFFGERLVGRERDLRRGGERGVMYVRVFYGRETKERLRVMTVSRGGW